MIMVFISEIDVVSRTKGRPIQSNIEHGTFVPGDFVTPRKLESMPVPNSNENYAIYQAIGKKSNIVIGNFRSKERTITLITDSNVDGKVDIVAHWLVDLNRIDIEPKPNEYCNQEKYAKMKEEILNGKSDTISPNPEGLLYARQLMKTPSNITKVRHGFRISMKDTDEPTMVRVSYFFSHHPVDGADIAFHIKYYNLGTGRVSPIINHTVYCKKSYDPFVIETAKKLIKETAKYYSH